MAFSVEYRLKDGVQWTADRKSFRSFQEMWTALYRGKPGTQEKEHVAIVYPERVRIGRFFGEDTVQALFEGSYPAALLWLLGIWDGDVTYKERAGLEDGLKRALCIVAGDCEPTSEEDSEESAD